jgi:hypothetical protein
MDKHDIRVTVKGREEGGWLDEADRNPHAYEIVLRICSVTWPRLPMIDRRFIDVSHTVEDGLITYKGLPAPVICD